MKRALNFLIFLLFLMLFLFYFVFPFYCMVFCFVFFLFLNSPDITPGKFIVSR